MPGWAPIQVARAYRAEHPGKFDEFDDVALLKAIKEIDPDTYALIDPLLEGSQLLTAFEPPPPPRQVVLPSGRPANPDLPLPLPTPPPPRPSGLAQVLSTGARVVPAVAGGLAGNALEATGVGAPLGAAVAGASGAFGEFLGQGTEMLTGDRDLGRFTPETIAIEGGLNALPWGYMRHLSRGGRIAAGTVQGGLIGGSSAGLRPVFEEERLPTAAEIGAGAVLGGGFGLGTTVAGEGIAALNRTLRSASSTDYGLPTAAGGPPSMVPTRAAYLAAQERDRVLAVVSQMEAQEITQEFIRRGWQIPPDQVGALRYGLEAKDYLEQIARLQQTPVAVPPIDAGLTPPPAAPPQLALPPPRPIEVFPADGPPPPPVEELAPGAAPRRIQMPSTLDRLETELDRSLSGVASEGPPRLNPQIQYNLRPPSGLRPQAAVTPIPFEGPPPAPEGPIVQSRGRIQEPQPGAPRLPEVDRPQPLDRRYTEGPNAGPRREGEAHGQPRPVRRLISTPAGDKYETAPANFPAEDPATYPPEVRRELAAIIWELEQFPYQRIQGGSTPKQIDALTEELGDVSSAVGEAKRRGATAGGAIAGAPVYHEIRQLVPHSHVDRPEMLRLLRQAVLEGRGSLLSDAAAQVARGRLAQRAIPRQLELRVAPGQERKPPGQRTYTRGRHQIRAQRGDEGDDLIGWIDEQGNRAIPEQDIDEFTRAAREADDAELRAAQGVDLEGVDPSVRPFYEAAQREAERRGLSPRGERPGVLRRLFGEETGAIQRDLLTGEDGPPSLEASTRRMAEEWEPPTLRSQRPLLDFKEEVPDNPVARVLEEERRRIEAAHQRPLPADVPAGTRVLTTADEYREMARRYGPPNAVDIGAGILSRNTGSAFVDDATGEIVAFAWPETRPAPKPRSSYSQAELDNLFGPGKYTAGAPEDVPLPGLEGVRDQNIPTPEVAEAPFALTPPPAKGSKAPAAAPSLLDRLSDEAGVLVLDIPANDRTGLKRWLKRQEKDHGGEAWYARVEEAIESGDWDRAWKAAAAASVRSYARAEAAVRTPEQRELLRRSVQGTPLQSDINAELIAGQRGREGDFDAPPVKDFPPSATVTQAGAARGSARLGPAGIINPGPPKKPLSTLAPSVRSGLLDSAVVKLLLEATSPEGMATIPGNQDTFLRLYRQVGEAVYRGQNLKLLREAGVRISPEELAQHFNQTVSDWGRGLQMLQQFALANREVLEEAAERMSMGGALRGMLGSDAPPPMIVGARNRPIGRLGRIERDRTLDVLAQDTRNYEGAMLANTLQRRKPIGALRALHDASYAFMLSKWNTAVRNYISFTGRYSVDSLDHALTIPIAQLLGDEPTTALSSALLRERGLQPMGRAGTAVPPTRSWQDTIQTIYDFTADSVGSLPAKDARKTLRLLLDLPDQAAQYLGLMTGEDLSGGFANTPVLRHLTNPKVQRLLTSFNRAQEFSARATVFDGTMRALLRARGLDPTAVLQNTPQNIAQLVGGQAAFEDLVATATAQALEATFAGRTAKDSLPGALIRFINSAWPLKLGIPFPRFNFSAAPRWIYDHSPAALLDLVRFPLDAAGITAPAGTAAGGRLYRGVRAQTIERKALPELAQKITAAEQRQGKALAELLATQREWQIRQRQINRLTARAQQGLPGVTDELTAAQQLQDQLGRRRETLKREMESARQAVKDLKSQQEDLLDVLNDARGINAPNFAQYMARIGTGTVGMLGAAWVVRAQEGAQGTRWYEYRVDREGQDPIILDFRPFAPFAQYLFVADVLQDFTQHTNWEAARAQAGEDGLAGPLDWNRAIWENYEGKYTAGELGAQFAQAFLSISRAAGTTLTLTDLLTQNGWPSLQDAADSIIGTVGQFLSRFTVPGQQVSDIAGQFDPEEAKARIPPRATDEEPFRPLGAPIANIPYARQVIPERISQTTGNPVAAEYPLLRALAGIGTAPRDFVVEEVRRIGLPAQSVFIRETGDYGLDRLVAETYSRYLQESLPTILEDDYYRELRTPARQRDFMQRYVFPAIKRAALGEVRASMDEGRWDQAMVRGEAARRARRLEALQAELGDAPVADPDAPPPGPGAPPPPPPADPGPPPFQPF